MNLYLQFGYGMMKLSKELFNLWGGGSIILSPRDLDTKQIISFPNSLEDRLKDCLIDPQFYLPTSEYARLNKHNYWPDDYQTSLLYSGLEKNLKALKELNDSAGATKYIIPSIMCTQLDDVWIKHTEQIISLSKKIFKGKPILATLPLNHSLIRDEHKIEIIINLAESWDVDGFYVVPEPPNNEYLVEDLVWVSNLLNLLAGLKLLDKFVILGYASHQMLSACITNIDAIASGTWLNVRSFNIDKFKLKESDPKRRATWYYCPHTYSEYKLQFLDNAYQNKILDKLKPRPQFLSEYVKPLFSGELPTNTNYSESNSHRHYLNSLHQQSRVFSSSSFDEAYDSYSKSLLEFKKNSQNLKKEGVFGQARDFNEIFDVNMASIINLKNEREFILKRKWN